MSLAFFADRIQETSTTTGNSTMTLAGAVAQYQSFASVIATSATVYYAITDATTGWECGIGTFTNSGTTLSRTTILASSNSGSAVSWGTGTKNVWLDFPAALIRPPAIIGVATTTADFGSTPIPSSVFTVTDANIVSTHNIIVMQSAAATSNRTADENGVDQCQWSAVAGTGQFTLYGNAEFGVISGQVAVNYLYS